MPGIQLLLSDAKEEKRQRDTVGARAYRDLAEITAVVQMTDSQKQEVLGVLIEQGLDSGLHGGAWFTDSGTLRSSYRDIGNPTRGGGGIGFRVASP